MGFQTSGNSVPLYVDMSEFHMALFLTHLHNLSPVRFPTLSNQDLVLPVSISRGYFFFRSLIKSSILVSRLSGFSLTQITKPSYFFSLRVITMLKFSPCYYETAFFFPPTPWQSTFCGLLTHTA